ncbi:zinc finger, CCHC-type containing protein [Tanacetum coccineum]|uniref:Zinc finger, CCHC-type containing protein n=1 Tax=Tanacetum coccineum TaxID=301880 RepID=A0ABQ5C4T2_9ASTR
MLTACYLLNKVPNKRNRITPYKLWTKRKPNLNYLRVWGCRAFVRLPDPKLKTLGERGIECIFIGYAEHSKAFRFYVTEPNESISINFIIKSRNVIFDENLFSLVPRPSQRSLINGTEDVGGSVVPEEVTKKVVTQQLQPELRKDKRNRTPKNFGLEFQVYLIEGTRDEVSNQHSYCFNVNDDPKTFDEAMKSQDVVFWKEANNDEIDFILGNNTWVLADLPPVARISTIRLLIAMTSINNLIIHQMNVKIAFLNGELDEEAPKQWYQKFNEVVLSSGYLLNQVDKCVYSKFDESSKGVIICLYVDDMLIFGTDQVQVDLTKEFLSSKFSMNDMGEACVILMSTPMDTSEKLMPNDGQAASQLKFSRMISCLMYAITCTRPDIAFAVGKLSRYTSNPGGGVISWASKKQTCIIGSTMKSEFVAVAAAGKEAEWLRNLIIEISLWFKPITLIFIRCHNAAT